MGATATSESCQEMGNITAKAKTKSTPSCTQLVEAGVQEPLELVHVVVQHGQDLAQPVLLEEGDLPRLDAVVDVHPQVVLHLLGEVHEPRLVDPLEEALEEEDDDREAGEHHGHAPGVAGAGERGDPFRRLAAQGVDDPADEERRHQVQDLVGDARARGQGHAVAVRAQVTEQADHGPPCFRHLDHVAEPSRPNIFSLNRRVPPRGTERVCQVSEAKCLARKTIWPMW